MRIDALALQSFRNYDALNVTFAPDCNVIVGENAQGKTNLLEAIVYLSSARSPRARAEKELISFGKSECSIKANAFARNRDFLLEIALAAGRRRKILINKVPVKKGSDLSDVLGAVYFCPEDLLLIRDGAAARRKFMDDALCQLRARYAQALSDYHRAYEHKTRILRDSEEYPSLLDTLPEFDLRMAQSGAVIIYYRARFCERLKEYAGIAHRECSGGREELGVEYQTVSTISDPLAPIETIYDQLRAHQASHAAAERASRMCLSGPHKDDIAVTIGGVNARQFSSQGQTRTAALAFKLAERGGRGGADGHFVPAALNKRDEFRLYRRPVVAHCVDKDDGTVRSAYRHAEPARIDGGGDECLKCLYSLAADAHNVVQRVYNDLIERQYDRHLKKQREAAGKRIEVLLLVHLLYLLRDLLLRRLVIASRIFFADSHFLRAQTCLLY